MKKYSLVIVLCLIIAVMAAVKITYKPVEVMEIKVVPTIVLTPTTNQYPLQDRLPYQGNKFVINKYVGAKVLQVTTKRTDREKIKEEIIKWFTDNQASIEGIQIDWK